MWGRWSDDPQASVTFTLPAQSQTLALLFWAHDWSGEAVITVDGEERTVDLFSAQGGIRRVELALTPGTGHTVEIRPAGTASPRSTSCQVIVFAAFDA
jgi:hypothetical protein